MHLAYLLKYRYGADALCCGWEGNSKKTVEMLCDWADFIIIVEAQMKHRISEEYHGKMRVFDCGPDRFFNPNNELLEIFDTMILTNIKSEGE